jgi:hypothetical protein
MPITNLNSWLPTLQEFVNHWSQVNTELGLGGPLLLLNGYAQATLVTDRTTLDTRMTAVVAADNVAVAARGDFDVQNAALVVRLKQFRGACKAYLPGSKYDLAPPIVPSASSIAGKFLTAYDDMANLWSQINTTPPVGFTPPLLLAGGFTLANFNTALTALRTASTAYTNGTENASIARRNRDLLMETLMRTLKQYRGAAESRLPSSSPLLLTIPALTAPAGGTPKAVNLSGIWNAGTDMADLTWTPSDNVNLDHYEIRYHFGPKYKASEEQPVDSVAPELTTFSTDFGLVAPGSIALFKVYVVTTLGNEKGSNAVKIVRT